MPSAVLRSVFPTHIDLFPSSERGSPSFSPFLVLAKSFTLHPVNAAPLVPPINDGTSFLCFCREPPNFCPTFGRPSLFLSMFFFLIFSPAVPPFWLFLALLSPTRLENFHPSCRVPSVCFFPRQGLSSCHLAPFSLRVRAHDPLSRS